MAAPRYGSHVQNLMHYVWHLGTRTADIAEVVSFDSPYDGRLVFFEVSAAASSGTDEAMTVDIQQGTTSLLDDPVAITAAARTEAVLAASPIFAKDTQISVDLNISGTDSPTFTEVVVSAVFERR